MTIDNLHISLTPIKNASRLLKQSFSLLNHNIVNNIEVVGIYNDGLKEREVISDKIYIWRIPLGTKKYSKNIFFQIIKYLEWCINIFLKYKNTKIKYIHCHSLASLPISVLLKYKTSAILIYDAHELEVEKNGLRGIRKIIAKRVEKLLIKYSDSVLVVSDLIKKWYEKKYLLRNVYLIRNVPSKQELVKSTILKEKLQISDNEILFIYQGALSKGRSIDLYLDVFSNINKDIHIVFMGYGEYENKIKEYEKNYHNIHFQPAVIPSEIQKYTSSADIGIHLAENVCLSYYYSLPNKIFEYILSGLPVIVSDFPEMAQLVDKYKVGWKSDVNKESLLKIINSLTKEEILTVKENVLKSRILFSWENEEKILLKAYGVPSD